MANCKTNLVIVLHALSLCFAISDSTQLHLTICAEMSLHIFLLKSSMISVTRLGCFWKIFSTNILKKLTQNVKQLLGYWKWSILGKNCCVYFFGQILKNLDQFFQHLVTLSMIEVSAVLLLIGNLNFTRRCHILVCCQRLKNNAIARCVVKSSRAELNWPL